jgi:hypothetical protein
MAEGELAFMWINKKLDSPHNGALLDLTNLTALGRRLTTGRANDHKINKLIN